jgi:hypothetical protein
VLGTQPMARNALNLLLPAALCGPVALLIAGALLVPPPLLAAQQSGDLETKLKKRSLSWTPPALDSPVRSLTSSPPCELANVLAQAGARESEQVTNLQNFTAQEKIEYRTSDVENVVQDLGSEMFDYIVVFQQSPGGPVFEEKRNPRRGSSLSPAATQDTGLPEIVLIFLPNMQEDYDMTCEGAAQWSGHLTWVVRFQQRKDKPSRSYSFRVGNSVYPVGLRGRAWIAADSGVVVHMETGLMAEVPAVRVRKAYLSIDYAPVQFQAQLVKIWLPKLVDGFWNFGDHRTIIYHTFSDFFLFSVQTEQKIDKPKQP